VPVNEIKMICSSVWPLIFHLHGSGEFFFFTLLIPQVSLNIISYVMKAGLLWKLPKRNLVIPES